MRRRGGVGPGCVIAVRHWICFAGICRSGPVIFDPMWVAPSRFAAVFRRGSSNARRSTSATDVPRLQPGSASRCSSLRRLREVR